MSCTNCRICKSENLINVINLGKYKSKTKKVKSMQK